MELTPRPFQSVAVAQAVEAILAGENPLFVSPTGSGKSFMGSLIVHGVNRRTLWVAHRTELVEQARDELAGLGVAAGVMLPGRPCYTRQVMVASVLTAVRRPLAGVGLIVIDEAHHAAALTHRKLAAMYPGVPVGGLTATPFRLDGRPLGDIFNRLIVAAYPDELVAAGHLVEPKVFAPPADALGDLKPDRSTGDFNQRRAAERMNKPKLVGDVVQTWLAHARGYRTIVFGCNCEHSESIAAAYRHAGVRAEHIDAETPADDRRAALARFRSGETTVLCNVELFTEGFNLPCVECVQLDRPTASLCLFLQMVGRVMRIHEGKQYPVVLDHAGNFLRHGRVTRRIEYTLDGRPLFAQPGGTGLRTCPSCFRMVASGRSACPECKHVFTAEPRELPDRADGVLQMYTSEQLDHAARTPEEIEAAEAEARAVEKDRKWFQLRKVAKKNGLSDAWVVSQYQKQTGEYRTVREVAPPSMDELLLFGGAA